jgi:hypothetical protein
MSGRSGYAKMYMITPRVWELVKKCIDDLETERINQLNINRNLQPKRTRSEQILSNISSMDINPIEETLLPRNLSPIPEISETYYNPDTQPLEQTYTEMTEPRINYSTQTDLPTEQDISTTNISSLTNIPTITYPTSNEALEVTRSTNIQPTRQIQSLRYTEPSPIEYVQPKSVTFKQPLAISYKKPVTYTRKRKSSSQYIEPITVADPFTQNYPTQDYNIQNISQPSESFGILPPPEYRSEEFEFNPKLHSTPIRKSKPKPSRIPLPILPLPSCTPTTVAKVQKRTLSTIEPLSKTAISKPQKAITTKIKPALTYSGASNDPQTSKTKALTYSPIHTRSKSRALVKKETYICPLCGLEFTTQVNMESHMRVLHNATSKNYDKWKK